MRRITLTLALLAALLAGAAQHPSPAAAAARDTPHVGSLVAFKNGHLGYVEKVTARGFVSIEGNAANSVWERFHKTGTGRVVTYRTAGRVLAGARSARSIPAGNDKLPLHVGSAGPLVLKLKFLIRDPRPKQNVLTAVKGTFTGPTSGATAGYLGKPAGLAIYDYKYRLGYPATYNVKAHPVAGAYFFGLLLGTAHRPASWVALAAKRLAAVEPGATKIALQVKALETSWIGITETYYSREPHYFNTGPCISSSCTWKGVAYPAIQAATGAFNVAWCVSTQQAAFKWIGYGTFADRTAGVFYAVRWAAARNLLHAKPKLGALVAFMDGQGHMGYVVHVTASGFVSIEGNSSNRVIERFHTFGDRRPVYIYLPRVA